MTSIDKNIPVPRYDRPQERAAAEVYRYDDMAVGDSVFIPESVRTEHTVRKYFSRRSRREGNKRFKVRAERTGTRVWRVA